MPASSSPAVTPPSAERPPARRSSAAWLLVLLLPLFMVLTPIVGVGAFFGSRWLRLRAAIADQGEVATVLDRYLSLLEAKDAEGAKKLIARSVVGEFARQQVTETRLAKSHLYENYKSIVLNDVRVTSDGPFIEASVSGTIEYENGTRAALTSGLDRDGDTWLVRGLKIEKSPAEGAADK